VNNVYRKQVQKLMQGGIKISACNATLEKMRANNMVLPIIEGVNIVPSGLVHVYELQKQGYIYLRP